MKLIHIEPKKSPPELGGITMRNLNIALRTVFAGIMLSAGVAGAAPADFVADVGLTLAFVPKSATEVTTDTIAFGGTRKVKATIAVPAGAVLAQGITVNFTSVPVNTTIPAGNNALLAGLVVTAVTNCTPTAAAENDGMLYPCTVADLKDGGSVDVVVTLSEPALEVLPTVCNQTATYPAPFTVAVTTTSTDPVPANNTASLSLVGVPLVFADLEAKFTGPTTAAEGATVVYDVTVTNLGPCLSQDVWVLSDAYGSSPYVSTTATCLNNPPDGLTVEDDGCQLGDIAVGTPVTFTKTYTIPNMATDAINLYHPNGVTLSRKVLNTAVTTPPLPARTMKTAALATKDYDLDNNSAGLRTVVIQPASGCSSSGTGGSATLLMLGAALIMAFRRRRTA
jgi:uncharacterized protein (TIGR03382 family)